MVPLRSTIGYQYPLLIVARLSESRIYDAGRRAILLTTCAVERHFLTKTCLLWSPLQSYENS